MKTFDRVFKKITAGLIAGACAFSLVACDNTGLENPKGLPDITEEEPVNEVTDEEPAGKELTDITFVLDWTPNTNHTGLYVALSEGFYEEEGLNVSIVQPPEDGATAMVATNKAQFGVDFQDYLVPIFTSEETIPVEVCATIIQHNTSAIISLKEDGIESPKDLEGKNYATWDLPIEKAMIQNIMEADGGDYSKLNLIPEYVENEAAALQQDIDAIWVYYAWGGIACEKAGLETNYIFFDDITPEFDFYSPVIIVNSDWAKENPETVKAFLRATAKGYEYAVSNPDAAADILCKEVPELDKDLVKASQEWISKEYKSEESRWGYIDQKRWDSFYKWLFDNGLSEEIPAGYGFTNEYLPCENE